MSDAVLDATVGLRAFLFDAVYENEIATAEFKKAAGILGGLWERSASSPASSSIAHDRATKGSTPPRGTSWPG